MSDVALDPRANYLEPLFGSRQPSRAFGRYEAKKEDYISRFYRLLRAWRYDTATTSRLQDKLDHPAFNQIIEIGKPAVPLIVRELIVRPDFLFLTLHRIVGEDVVPPGVGPHGAIEAWLAWATRNRVPSD